MTRYFIGKGGRNTNDGLTYETRHQTNTRLEKELLKPGDEVLCFDGALFRTFVAKAPEENPIFYVSGQRGMASVVLKKSIVVTDMDVHRVFNMLAFMPSTRYKLPYSNHPGAKVGI